MCVHIRLCTWWWCLWTLVAVAQIETVLSSGYCRVRIKLSNLDLHF